MFRIEWLFLILSILCGALGQVFFKMGVGKVSTNQLSFSFFFEVVKNPWVLLGCVSYGISFLLWMYILKFFEVSFARPLNSVGYIITYIFAIILLGEAFTIRRFVAIIIIITGVILLSIK